MRERLIEPYEPGTSAVHRASAALKLAAVLTFLLALLAVPRGGWAWFAAAAGLLVAVVALARVSPARVALRVLALEPFAIGVALLALIPPGGPPAFAHLVVRSSLALAAVVLFAATTRFTDLLGVLRGARVPALFVTTLALAYRYLFLLFGEASRLDRARRSRTFSSGRSTNWRLSASAVAQLFLRATARAERVHAALCARGWRP